MDTATNCWAGDVAGDGLPFRFRGFRSECLGHFQSKPKLGDWMGIESRPQLRTAANASVTQTQRERVLPAPRTVGRGGGGRGRGRGRGGERRGPFSSSVVRAIWQLVHNEWFAVHSNNEETVDRTAMNARYSMKINETREFFYLYIEILETNETQVTRASVRIFV